MNIYTLTILSLLLFIIFLSLLAFSFNPDQMSMYRAGVDDEIIAQTYSKYQKVLSVLGALSWGFTVAHGTIAAAVFLAGLI